MKKDKKTISLSQKWKRRISDTFRFFTMALFFVSLAGFFQARGAGAASSAPVINPDTDLCFIYKDKKLNTSSATTTTAPNAVCCCTSKDLKEGAEGKGATATNCPTGVCTSTPMSEIKVGSDTFPVVDPNTGEIKNQSTNPLNGFNNFVSRWYIIGFYIAVVLSVLMVIYGGFVYVTAAGSGDKVGEAKTIITDALIGLGVAVLAGAILVFLRGTKVFSFG